MRVQVQGVRISAFRTRHVCFEKNRLNVYLLARGTVTNAITFFLSTMMM
jgi:hypothetical protein